MTMRRAARLDDNQPHIVAAFLSRGCEVQSLAALGNGVADLLVWHKATRRLFLVEVKNPKRSPSARKLKPDQVEWHERFPVHVVMSVEQAEALLRSVDAFVLA